MAERFERREHVTPIRRPHDDPAPPGSAPGPEASVVRLVTEVIRRALERRASDIHIEPHVDRLTLRFRIDGTLIDVETLPLSSHPALINRLKVLAGMNIVERRRPQDGRLSVSCGDRNVDIRVATLATIHGEKMVLRLLDQNRTRRGLGELGMCSHTIRLHRTLMASPFGLLLCAGPTGSGKTTTLYASLEEMNIAGRNVTTIEDPVEYVFDGINQVRTNDQAGLTFASGLRALLRQDPDVILIGEVRDAETARLGVQAALTGHIVLSSIHATDAAGALQRLLDMGVESFLISSSLIGVVGQRLVRRICTGCAEPATLGADELSELGPPGPDDTFRRGAGCSSCGGTGYFDRIGVYEILRMTPTIRKLLAQQAAAGEIHCAAVADGMIPMREAALHLVRAGLTTIDEVARALLIDEGRTTRTAPHRVNASRQTS